MQKLKLYDDLPNVLKGSVEVGSVLFNIPKDNIEIYECDNYQEFKDLIYKESIEIEMLSNRDASGSIISVILFGTTFNINNLSSKIEKCRIYYKELTEFEFDTLSIKYKKYKETNDLKDIL